jgi:hypothetical protein
MKIILFLCAVYPRRFAEELFNFAALVECSGWTAISRGIAVDLGIELLSLPPTPGPARANSGIALRISLGHGEHEQLVARSRLYLLSHSLANL